MKALMDNAAYPLGDDVSGTFAHARIVKSRSPWRRCWNGRCGFTLIELVVAAGITLGSARGQTVYKPGRSYFGRSNYVEYIAGDMPLIISAPHGGTLRPGEIPDRKEGDFTSDAYTKELARTLQQAFHDGFGHYPHVIICRLDRRKVDCNRDIAEGAGANTNACWSAPQRS